MYMYVYIYILLITVIAVRRVTLISSASQVPGVASRSGQPSPGGRQARASAQ